MRRDLQRFGHVAGSENHEIVLRFLDQTAFVQNLRGDLVTRIEVLFDLGKADLDPLLS